MLPLLIKVHGIANNILNKLSSSGRIKENRFTLHEIFSANVRKKITSQFFYR